jgi:hypothetical protein
MVVSLIAIAGTRPHQLQRCLMDAVCSALAVGERESPTFPLLVIGSERRRW